jgi:hypothetical protein
MGKHIRKSARNLWSKENIRTAIKDEAVGSEKTSRIFNVLEQLLDVEWMVKIPVLHLIKCKFQEARFLPTARKELKNRILRMQASHCGLTTEDLRSLSFQPAENKKLRYPFNSEKKLSGEDWLQVLLYRHPHLSLRFLESNFPARSRAFGEINMKRFPDFLQE